MPQPSKAAPIAPIYKNLGIVLLLMILVGYFVGKKYGTGYGIGSAIGVFVVTFIGYLLYIKNKGGITLGFA